MIISFVIPCYNEEEVIKETLDRVYAVGKAHNWSFEILCVDDGSKDQTWRELTAWGSTHPELRAIRLTRNFGHQAALSTGLRQARGNRVLILDADLQDPPELASQMMAKMDEGYDIVYGKRLSRRGENPFKLITAYLFYRFINLLSDIDIPRDTGDFRLLSRTAVDAFKEFQETSLFIRGIFSWIGLPQTALEYERDERQKGETKYTLRKMLSFAVDGITGFSIRPLKIALLLAFIMAFIAVWGAGWTIYSWNMGGTVRGWASVLTACFLIGACQLLVLGIIGEYLGRLFIETKRRPVALIRDHWSAPASAETSES